MSTTKKFKCPICGCEEHYQLKALKFDYGKTFKQDSLLDVKLIARELEGSINLNVESNAEAYLCKNCGHVELFAEDLLLKIKKEELDILNNNNEVNQKLEKLSIEKEQLTKELPLKEKRMIELDKLLKSEDITIRQQREYQEERNELANQIRRLPDELKSLERNIEQLKKQLR